MKTLYTSLLTLLFGSAALAQSTGFLPPTATAAPNGWTSPANAFLSDDQWASVAHQSGCRCPWVYLSWDGGTSYTNYHLMGPFGTTDGTQVSGSPSDNWGHTWTYTEFSNTNFRLKIANPSMSIEQGWSDFNFSIPSNAIITGIEVKLEWHGDPNFTMEYLDQALVNVYYTATTGISSVTSSSLISIFPNPNNGKMVVSANGLRMTQLNVLNIQGQEVLVKEMDEPAAELDLSLLPKGIYFIEVSGEFGVTREKIVIE